MDDHDALLEPLLTGLPAQDRATVLSRLQLARAEQLDSKRHPPQRRRRGVDGVLAFPEEQL